VLARDSVYRESLAAVATPTELIAEPFTRFIAMATPSATPSAPDTGLTFTAVAPPALQGPSVIYFPDTTGTPSTYTLDVSGVRDLLPFDADHDFRTDMLLVDPAGLRLLRQTDR